MCDWFGATITIVSAVTVSGLKNPKILIKYENVLNTVFKHRKCLEGNRSQFVQA